jgi:hypothetical protein
MASPVSATADTPRLSLMSDSVKAVLFLSGPPPHCVGGLDEIASAISFVASSDESRMTWSTLRMDEGGSRDELDPRSRPDPRIGGSHDSLAR